MTAILIDFATRRAMPSQGRPRPDARLSHDERSDLRRNWSRRQWALQAASHEHQALELRFMLAPVDSPARNKLHAALEIAAEARELAREILLRTPAPSAEALAWKKRQRDRSPEAERVMIEDEVWLDAVNGNKRRRQKA